MIKLALTYIVKDDTEAESFELSLKYFMPYFDGLYVALTGTSGRFEKCKKLIRSYKGRYMETSPSTHPQIYSEIDGKVVFSNFAEARTASWSLIKDTYDYICWADTDDILTGGDQIRNVAQMAKEKGMDVVYMPYWYSCRFNDKGQVDFVNIDHMRERLIAPGKFKWVSRLHEVAVPIDGFSPNMSEWNYEPEKNQNVAWIHTASNEKIASAMERNIAILTIQAEEQEYKDPRTVFYLAKTYFDKQEDDKAEQLLAKYRESSGWDEERAHSWEYSALICMRRGDLRKALSYLHKGNEEYPKHHTIHLRLADCYFQLGDWEKGEFWLNVVRQMPAPQAKATIGNKLEIHLLLVSLEYMLAEKNKDINSMLAWAKRRAQVLGEDDGLYQRVLQVKNLATVNQGVFNLAKYLKDSNQLKYIPKLLEALPAEIGQEPFVHMIANDVMEPKKWGDKTVVYFASFGGAHFEEWCATSLDKGIGGSESAVIELAKEWVKLGYEVTVYCDCGSQAGEYEGVIYKPYYQFNWKDEFNILILWRSPHLVNADIKAKKLFMDLHDVPSVASYPQEVVEKLDKIFVKSQYHRSLLPKIPDEKFVIISNGVDRR